MDRIAPSPGQLLADIGCGPGTYHARLVPAGVRVIGLDASFGMLVEARAETDGTAAPALLSQAMAEHLPLAPATVDCVMANHMLYHVGDQRAALQEMWRVLKPGGRLVVTTNSADANRRLHQLHHEAARALGYTPLTNVVAAFHGGHGHRVERIFPGATTHEYVDAFLFPTTEAALRYYASAMIDEIAERPADDGHRPLLLAEMARRIDAIMAAEGVFRVPKGATCFTAIKEGG